jgi:hypothetical protein
MSSWVSDSLNREPVDAHRVSEYWASLVELSRNCGRIVAPRPRLLTLSVTLGLSALSNPLPHTRLGTGPVSEFEPADLDFAA